MPTSHRLRAPLLAVLFATASACETRQITGGGGGGGGVIAGGAYAFRVGAAGADEARHIVRTIDGGVVIVGEFTGTVDFDPSAAVATRIAVGSTDAFAMRLDSTGALQWATVLGGPGADLARAVAVAPDGRIIVTGGAAAGFQCVGGITLGAGSGPRDAFITVLTADGLCDRTIIVGGAGSDEGRAIAVAAGGDVFVTGTYAGPADFDPTGSDVLLQPSVPGDLSDAFVARYGLDGTLRWAVPIGGRGSDQAWALRLDDVQQVVVAGTFTDTIDVDPSASQRRFITAGGSDIWVASLTTSGLLRWGERLGGPVTDVVSPHALAVSTTREVYLGGQFGGSMTLGTIVGLPPLAAIGATDAFVARLDANGVAAGGFVVGGAGDDAILGLQPDAVGTLIVVGAFQGTVDFSRGVAARVLVATSTAGSGGADLFTARYTDAGLLQWAERLRTAATPSARPTAALTLDPATFWIAGRFAGTFNADPGSGFATLAALGGTDAYAARYTNAGGAVVRR